MWVQIWVLLLHSQPECGEGQLQGGHVHGCMGGHSNSACLVMWPWASEGPSLSLSLPLYKMEPVSRFPQRFIAFEVSSPAPSMQQVLLKC